MNNGVDDDTQTAIAAVCVRREAFECDTQALPAQRTAFLAPFKSLH
jgi:hypothetical protein